MVYMLLTRCDSGTNTRDTILQELPHRFIVCLEETLFVLFIIESGRIVKSKTTIYLDIYESRREYTPLQIDDLHFGSVDWDQGSFDDNARNSINI